MTKPRYPTATGHIVLLIPLIAVFVAVGWFAYYHIQSNDRQNQVNPNTGVNPSPNNPAPEGNSTGPIDSQDPSMPGPGDTAPPDQNIDPPEVKSGFKLVETGCFSVQIPDDWELQADPNGCDAQFRHTYKSGEGFTFTHRYTEGLYNSLDDYIASFPFSYVGPVKIANSSGAEIEYEWLKDTRRSFIFWVLDSGLPNIGRLEPEVLELTLYRPDSEQEQEIQEHFLSTLTIGP